MTYTQLKFKKQTFLFKPKSIDKSVSYLLPILLMISIYFSGSLEISRFWNQLLMHVEAGKKLVGKEYGEVFTTKEFDLFRGIWQSIYAMIFLVLLSYVNIKKIKNYYLGWVNMVLEVWVLFLFVTVVCYNLNVLQDTNLHSEESLSFHQNGLSAFIRYISFGSGCLLLYSLKKYGTQKFIYPTPFKLLIAFDIILNVFVFTVGSYQLVHFFFLYTDDPSLGKQCLSIMWGIYALILIMMGIAKHQKHLRIMAIVLFSITLIKLFIYDTQRLGTIGKTIVFVSLGILLLIVSYLYNKYKSKLLEEPNVE
jgi:hypothetical protein